MLRRQTPSHTWASATNTLNDSNSNTQVTTPEAYLTNAEYTAHAAPQRQHLGNGLYEASQYNAFLQTERKRIGANAIGDQLCLDCSFGAFEFGR